MKRWALVVSVILTVMTTACSTHYYRVEGVTVRMYVELENARQVLFASSLDGYEVHRARRISPHVWEYVITANRTFSYFYIVDETVYLPPCRYKEQDDFGGENCIYVPGL